MNKRNIGTFRQFAYVDDIGALIAQKVLLKWKGLFSFSADWLAFIDKVGKFQTIRKLLQDAKKLGSFSTNQIAYLLEGKQLIDADCYIVFDKKPGSNENANTNIEE